LREGRRGRARNGQRDRAGYSTRLRETWVENCCDSSVEGVPAMLMAPAISAGRRAAEQRDELASS
jgi:hypothetical protein